MHRLLPLLLVGLLLGCAEETPPTANLVPVSGLQGLLPESIGDFEAAGDEVYRGYFADSTGSLALVTVARTFLHGIAMMTLNVSSMDHPERYLAILEAGGARATPDSVVAAEPALADARAQGWGVYDVAYGRLLLHADGRAVEAKSMVETAPQEALAAIDLSRLHALAEEPVPVDSSFTHVSPPVARAEVVG